MSSQHGNSPAGEGYDRQEPPVMWIVSFLFVLFVFVVASGFGIQVYFGNHVRDELHHKVGETPNVQWQTLKTTSDKHLNSYGWVEGAAGAPPAVRLPISRAMELTVRDLAVREQGQASNGAPAGGSSQPARK